MGEQREVPKRERKLPVVHMVIGVVLIVCILIAGVVFLQRSGPRDAKAQSEMVIRKVSKLYLLPSDEQPTVAEIKDVLSLNDQEFYKDAKNGDFVLVYSKAKIALLYRESLNKLIKVSPVSATSEKGPQTEGTNATR